MWNAPNKPIPRSQIVDTAIEALEAAHTAMLEEEGPRHLDPHLATLCALHEPIRPYAERFYKAYTHKNYDISTRFEATGQALRLLKVQFGR